MVQWSDGIDMRGQNVGRACMEGISHSRSNLDSR